MREVERVSVGINGQYSLWIYKFKQSSNWYWFLLGREGGRSGICSLRQGEWIIQAVVNERGEGLWK